MVPTYFRRCSGIECFNGHRGFALFLSSWIENDDESLIAGRVQHFRRGPGRHGHYATPDDVFRDALKLMERHVQTKAERLAWLQRAYQAGIDSGFVDGPPDFEAIKAEGRMRREKSAR